MGEEQENKIRISENFIENPQSKKDARHNIKLFWFYLYDNKKGSVFKNLPDEDKKLMEVMYRDLSLFDKRKRKDLKRVFDTDRIRYWTCYKKEKKPFQKNKKCDRMVVTIDKEESKVDPATLNKARDKVEVILNKDLKKASERVKKKEHELNTKNAAFNRLSSQAKTLEKAIKEMGVAGMYQINMLRELERNDYYGLKVRRKVAYNDLLLELAQYITNKIRRSEETGEKIPLDLIRHLSDIFKSFKDLDEGDKADVSMPKDIIIALQNNKQEININQKKEEVSDAILDLVPDCGQDIINTIVEKQGE